MHRATDHAHGGIDITVSTPPGGPPAIDERSIDPEEVGEATADRIRSVHETDERLNDPSPLPAVDAEEYDAVVFPGGHGAVWDITQDRHARQALATAVSGDARKALVVCHAVGILGFTRAETGEWLSEDRNVTGVPNAWEEGIVDEYDRLPDERKLPYWVEDEVTAVGGNWNAKLDSETSVTVDGDLITARGPASSTAAAQTLLSELEG